MKLLPTILFFVALAPMIQSKAQDSKKEKAAKQEQAIQTMTSDRRFVFQAQSASPMKGGTRQLSPGYTIVVKGDTVDCYLPYYGRAYSASINPSDAGIKFTSSDYEYIVNERKKGGFDITIAPKDVHNSVKVYLSVARNGSASARVTSSDRQPISFNGYLEAYEDKKK